MTKESRWPAFVESLRGSTQALNVCFPRTFPDAWRLVVCESGVFLCRRILQFARQIHDFVITEQHVNIPAGGGCFVLQAHQQVENLPGICATVYQIANTHYMRRATDPVEIFVDNTCILQEISQFIISAVHVAESDNPFDSRPA